MNGRYDIPGVNVSKVELLLRGLGGFVSISPPGRFGSLQVPPRAIKFCVKPSQHRTEQGYRIVP